MLQKIRELLYLDHRPIQAFIATLWLFYGLTALLHSAPYLTHPIDHSDILPVRVEGMLLIGVAFLGFLGLFKKSLKTDLVFALFSLYKNTVAAASAFLASGLAHSWWVNEVVQFLACIVLLNKTIVNIHLSKIGKTLT
jgi:hypothetical protein